MSYENRNEFQRKDYVPATLGEKLWIASGFGVFVSVAACILIGWDWLIVVLFFIAGMFFFFVGHWANKIFRTSETKNGPAVVFSIIITIIFFIVYWKTHNNLFAFLCAGLSSFSSFWGACANL